MDKRRKSLPKNDLKALRNKKKILNINIDRFSFDQNIAKDLEETIDTSLDQVIFHLLYNSLSQDKFNSILNIAFRHLSSLDDFLSFPYEVKLYIINYYRVIAETINLEYSRKTMEFFNISETDLQEVQNYKVVRQADSSKNTAEVIVQLEKIKGQQKFQEAGDYTGIKDEETRGTLNQEINNLLDKLVQLIKEKKLKQLSLDRQYVKLINELEEILDDLDTEDRDEFYKILDHIAGLVCLKCNL